MSEQEKLVTKIEGSTNNVGHVAVNGELDTYGYQKIAGEILALQGEGVSKIVLAINSPGGDVLGIDTVLNVLKSSPIPVETLITGLCASSAYWIASQTSRITAIGSNVLVGSIGVTASMYSMKSYMKNLGIEEWLVVSDGSPKKVSQTKEDFIAQEQPVVNELFHNFVKAVSGGRGVTVDNVLKTFGQGDVLTSTQALKVGMIDAIFQKETNQNIIESIPLAIETPVPVLEKAKVSATLSPNKILQLEPRVPARWREESEVGLTAKIETQQRFVTHFYNDFRKQQVRIHGEKKGVFS